MKKNSMSMNFEQFFNVSITCYVRIIHSLKYPYATVTRCLLYGDCCFDYLEQSEKNPQPFTENVNRYREVQTFQQFYSCSTWCYGRHYSVVYQFLSSCPDGTNAYLVDMCVNNDFDVPMTMIPVVGANGIHFRNRFCASCHNISVVNYWKLIIDEGAIKISIPQSELTKEMLLHVFAQSHCISVVIPPGNEDIRNCVETIDTHQNGVTNVSFQFGNNSYTNREICGKYKVPIYGNLQQNTDSGVTRFSRVAFLMNSTCIPAHSFMNSYSCVKGSDIAVSDILSRHLYDKYSLSSLFQFDHLLPQLDSTSCENNKHMFTFLVSNYMKIPVSTTICF